MDEKAQAAAELAYTSTAFDYVRAPVGSRDWHIFLQGFLVGLEYAQPVVKPAAPEQPHA